MPYVLSIVMISFFLALPYPVLSAAEEEFNANHSFALKLFQKFADDKDKKGNFIFSPSSVATALEMAMLGARGKTALQMAETLGLSQQKSYPLIWQERNKSTHSPSSNNVQLLQANRLWGRQGLLIEEDYIQALKTRFASDLVTADFTGDPQACRQEINTWVADKTQQNIKNLIGPGDISADTSLILVNSIYFAGTWITPFDEKKTQAKRFLVNREKTSFVPIMQQTLNARFAVDGEGVKFLELPYAGKEYSMVLVLPPEGKMDALEDRMIREFSQLVNDLLTSRPQEVDVSLPRFRLAGQYPLEKNLQQLGIKDAFTPRADFSGITNEQLYITKVSHAATIEVDEKGSKASASTAVIMSKGMAQEFNANRPFVFMILHRPSLNILFMGRLTDPQS
jgi:serine protease inhibitor